MQRGPCKSSLHLSQLPAGCEYIFVVTAVVLGLDSNTYSRYIVVVRFLQLICMYDTSHTFAHITFAHIYRAARTSLPERSRGGTR